jgi:hypothetical protein
MDYAEVPTRIASSFRDPNGYVFLNNTTKRIQRIIFPSYFSQYEHFISSGLYDDLLTNNQIINHQIITKADDRIIIEPKEIAFITYPYEWSFNFLKDAALLTLQIAIKSLNYGMYLKDATSYNIQLFNGRPIFIDLLSFELYQEEKPWGAYGQFCQHFLAPLLLMKYKSLSTAKMLSNFIDGIPLDLASRLLPLKTHFSLFIKTNIHLHAKKLNQTNSAEPQDTDKHLSKRKLIYLLSYMESFIESLDYVDDKTEWSNYYGDINYTPDGFKEKSEIVSNWIKQLRIKSIWDAGGNNGYFSRLISSGQELILCTDIDPIAVDKNYLINKKETITNILPLVIDITNPSPCIGFNNKERTSFSERLINKKVDCALALALIHHLCISNNWNFSMFFEYFSNMSDYLIVEFIPPEDSWVKKLLSRKKEFKFLFDYYNQNNFEQVCVNYYTILKKINITDSCRVLYLLKRDI